MWYVNGGQLSGIIIVIVCDGINIFYVNKYKI
jgi:hypothetical protein